MPTNPLSKLLDRRKPTRSDVEQALAQLAQLSEQHPDLVELAATHAALLRVSFRDTPPVPPVSLELQQAATKLQGGVPLLRGEPLAFDGAWLRERYVQLCEALADVAGSSNTGSATRSGAQALRQAVKRGMLDIQALATDVVAGDPYTVAQRAEQLELEPQLAATVLRWTLLPILEQVAKQVEQARHNLPWDKGYCPVCGAWPILAERRGLEQTLLLRCGLCAAEWPIDNIFCPFCSTRTHFDIGYLYDESQEANQRVMTCERCHCYYKSVRTLAALTTPQLFVMDLATFHLDLIALERTYGPPG